MLNEEEAFCEVCLEATRLLGEHRRVHLHKPKPYSLLHTKATARAYSFALVLGLGEQSNVRLNPAQENMM